MSDLVEQGLYHQVKDILAEARSRAYASVNFAMVEAYWHVGEAIVRRQGGTERAEYGDGLIQQLSVQLTKDFGRGFTTANLKYMRLFYLSFPIGHALSDQLS
jgi:hypothetical protein